MRSSWLSGAISDRLWQGCSTGSSAGHATALMRPIGSQSHALSKARARCIWLRAQRLETAAPFGDGPQVTRAAVEHLGYVQIDTINVIERCHHHILFTRIPSYQRT